ncbi:MAG: VOC family protein [Boseongicola sp.]|nr:VOC family protein [Boseongicola sp.]
MSTARLEHINMTVSDPHATAAWLGRVFGWKIRWEGAGMQTGYSVHCGDSDTYVALFTYPETPGPKDESYVTLGGFNHWAVVVDDLDAVEERVKAEGFQPINHANYEPGRRFYFHDGDGIEIEVVQYD